MLKVIRKMLAPQRLIWFAAIAVLTTLTNPVSARESDEQIIATLLVDRFEYRASDGDDSVLWDVEGWIGDDYNKAWFKTEGDDQFDPRCILRGE